MKTMEAFYSEIMADEMLARELNKAYMEDRLASFLDEYEVAGTAREFEAFVSEKKKQAHMLSDDAIADAAGGGMLSADHNQAADFAFQVGDWVKIRGYLWRAGRGRIIAVDTVEDFLGRVSPLYQVRLNNGEVKWFAQTQITLG